MLVTRLPLLYDPINVPVQKREVHKQYEIVEGGLEENLEPVSNERPVKLRGQQAHNLGLWQLCLQLQDDVGCPILDHVETISHVLEVRV